MVEIRPCRLEECPDVLALWQRADAIPSPTDSLEELTRLVRAHADYLLLAFERGAVVGSIIGGWDGWRGDIYRLAVAPDARRLGMAPRFADPAAGQETAIGSTGVNIEVEANPTAGNETASHLGRRTAARLRAFDRGMDLRGIDADVAELLDPIGKLNGDRLGVA